MRWTKSLTVVAIGAISAGAGWAAGCGGSDVATAASVDAGGTGNDAGGACVACIDDGDCNGGVCAQIGGDSYCTPTCPNGDECSADRACTPVATISGAQVSACVPRSDGCGVTPPDPDASTPPSEVCGALVGPDVKASCACSRGKTCAANQCYGGWWCNTATNRCQAPPFGCVGGDAGVPFDAGGAVTSQIDSDGGTESRLYFAIIGDTRPATVDDTAGYPTPIITKIWSDVAAMTPMPPFTISTGDYQFASAFGPQAAPQLDLYLGARAAYPGVTFPAMGNHECTGATASNCGAGTVNGTTTNYASYLAKMLAPIAKTDPYYEIDVNAPDASWTCKLLFIAANAWTDAQAAWLDAAMARATTYTIVVRHEPAQASTAPGVTPSETIMAQHPYTLSIVGHTHTYEHFHGREIVVGNGGAPLSGSKNFGYGIVDQNADGSLSIDMVDYMSGLADAQFHFAVKADGTIL